MCFEWDKRYFRELEEKKNKEKVDQLIKDAEAAVQAEQQSAPTPSPTAENKENTVI
jgi:hypothetical protein